MEPRPYALLISVMPVSDKYIYTDIY